MAFETKEEVLQKILDSDKPQCPHCSEEMNLWEVPLITFSDGLGWGTPYLFVCFNDKCSVYQEGWDNLKENYAQNASYRCINYPGTTTFELMPVFSPVGAQGQIIDDAVLAQQKALEEATKKGFSLLATCYVEKDWPSVLRVLLDSGEPVRVRIKAAEMMGDFAELESIDPMRGARFGNEKLQKQVDATIKKVHERFYTRECPYCAEIIKKRAKVCKHCGLEVAGQ